MTVQLTLPAEVERRLMAEVHSGRHLSLEEAIMERLTRDEEPNLAGLDAHALRADLDQAWSNRSDAIDGDAVFEQIAAKSAMLRAQGR